MNTENTVAVPALDDARPSAAPADEGETEITLGVLSAIDGNSALTQRSLARELGIALGLANAYLKRCVRKGLVKVSQVPRNRYAYYLTPQGFAEKSRLTAKYLSQSFLFFREARAQGSALLETCALRGWRRLALCGAGELAEILILCARDYRVELAGVIDGAVGGASFAGLPVVKALAELGPVDALIVTDLADPQATFEAMLAGTPSERVLTPRLLKVSRGRAALANGE